MHGKLIRLSLIALFLVAATGCGNTSNPPQATPAATESAALGGAQPGGSAYPAPGSPAYPGPDAANTSPYPGPQSVPTVVGPEPQPIPQPSAGNGVIHGMVYDQVTNQPIFNGVTVYLAPLISTSSSQMDAVSVDTANDPSATPDREGGFAFADVPPGRYGVVVQGPINQYLARMASDQAKEVVLTIEAGQTVDLGKIYSGYP